MGRLDELNALADSSAGFVWRLQTNEGNATYFRPYPHDDRILLNMSVWESIEMLKHYVYHTMHAELLRQRNNGSRNLPVCILLSGGCPSPIVQALMKRRSGWRTWNSTVLRSSPSTSKPLFSPTRSSRKGSTGLRSCPAPRCGGILASR